MKETVKAKALKAHERCHAAYHYAEQGCAITYAICEFAELHLLLIWISAALLVLGIAILLLKAILEVM